MHKNLFYFNLVFFFFLFILLIYFIFESKTVILVYLIILIKLYILIRFPDKIDKSADREGLMNAFSRAQFICAGHL